MMDQRYIFGDSISGSDLVCCQKSLNSVNWVDQRIRTNPSKRSAKKISANKWYEISTIFLIKSGIQIFFLIFRNFYENILGDYLMFGLRYGRNKFPLDLNQSKNKNSKAVHGAIRRQLAKFPLNRPGIPSL